MTDSEDLPFVVDVNETIEGVLAAIEQNGHRSVIVVDEQRRVMGTVSDGDVRKAILAHRVLATPVTQIMTRNCLTLMADETDRAAALFAREHIFLIPVVDNEGRLVRVLRAY